MRTETAEGGGEDHGHKYLPTFPPMMNISLSLSGSPGSSFIANAKFVNGPNEYRLSNFHELGCVLIGKKVYLFNTCTFFTNF